MNLRKATINDLEVLFSLLEQLGYKQDMSKLKKRFEKFLSFDGYGIMLAEQYGQVAGMIAWSRSMLLISDTTRIRIEALIVNKEWRRQG